MNTDNWFPARRLRSIGYIKGVDVFVCLDRPLIRWRVRVGAWHRGRRPDIGGITWVYWRHAAAEAKWAEVTGAEIEGLLDEMLAKQAERQALDADGW